MTSFLKLPEHVNTLADLEALGRCATRHDLSAGDCTVVWHVWGTGTPLVLLHGGSGSWNHWARNITALVAAGWQVLIPDLPGFGASSRPVSGEDADVLPEPLEATLRQLIGETRFALVGFSFGSMVAAFMAKAWPERINRLVLMGAPALGVHGQRPFKLRAWLGTAEGAERDLIHRHNLGVLMLSGPEQVDELAIQIHGMNLARDRLQKRRLSYTDILLRTIREIAAPTYCIWGELDVLYLGRHEALRDALHEAKNFQSLDFIAGAGHWVQYEKPEAFNRALLKALEA